MILFKNILFYIVLLFSVVIHEFIHALSARKLGDDSKQNAERLTLNPVPHIDIWGTLLLPLLLLLSNTGIIIGWAKPVRVDVKRLRSPGSMILISLAGPLTNFMLAVIFFIIAKTLFMSELASGIFREVLFFAIIINVILFLFNMLPIPPLDGSKPILFALSGRARQFYAKWGSLLMIPLLILIVTGIMTPIFTGIFKFIAGML
ncbi:MAG: site-2 protease family protein [bacterium]